MSKRTSFSSKPSIVDRTHDLEGEWGKGVVGCDCPIRARKNTWHDAIGVHYRKCDICGHVEEVFYPPTRSIEGSPPYIVEGRRKADEKRGALQA